MTRVLKIMYHVFSVVSAFFRVVPKHLLFADDLAILAEDDTFGKVEAKLEIALKSTGNYY